MCHLSSGLRRARHLLPCRSSSPGSEEIFPKSSAPTSSSVRRRWWSLPASSTNLNLFLLPWPPCLLWRPSPTTLTSSSCSPMLLGIRVSSAMLCDHVCVLVHPAANGLDVIIPIRGSCCNLAPQNPSSSDPPPAQNFQPITEHGHVSTACPITTSQSLAALSTGPTCQRRGSLLLTPKSHNSLYDGGGISCSRRHTPSPMARVLHRRLLLLLLAALTFAVAASLLRPAAAVRPFVLVLSGEDFLKDSAAHPSLPSADSADDDGWDDFADDSPAADPLLSPSSWVPLLDPTSPPPSGDETDSPADALFVAGARAMLSAASDGDDAAFATAAGQIEAAAEAGHPGAQSALAFLTGAGMTRPASRSLAFLLHKFAADAGDLQSKMALAYSYFRQEMYEEAVILYAELAEAALTSSLISKEPPVIEPIRLHSGTEENKEALRKSRGEDDEDFQITEYQAQRGNAANMYKLGLLYYYGLRGLRRDYGKAFHWFSKAVEKGETRALELLGEIYARGAGVERNYTEAYKWLALAAKQQHYSAYNGLGYLYVKGYGVEKKNLTKARELFELAAENKEAGGHYNLGVLYLKGIGVKRDVIRACNLLLHAVNAGQPKAIYQVAKLFQKGIGLKTNLHMATMLYKSVAERGPWSSLSRWALESYLKGDVGKAFLLYSRMADLGYEVAQSNAAWILDRYGDQSICMGESSYCTDMERHLRAHALWWQASEQGNEHAALLIGDAYYYGRGVARDYERAAEAYMHARSQSNAQAIFNLGYMHEHGHGLPLDLHLAKRYYDQAVEVDSAAKLPVMLALTSLWLRKNYADSFLVRFIDSLPEIYPVVKEWVEDVLMDEGNATILTLFACLVTVLYLRERQRRQVAAANPQQPDDVAM